MRLGQLLLQETIRSIALGYLVFLFLGLIHTTLGLSAGQVLAVSGIAALGIFLSFTAMRLRTGQELMARTRREWTIVAVVGAVVLGGFMVLDATAGHAPWALRFGPLQVSTALFALILFAWLGYRSAVGRR